MSVIAVTVFKPFLGKRVLAEERIRKVAEIYENIGATVKATRFVAGENTGCFGLVRAYPDFKTSLSMLTKLSEHPSYKGIMRQREAEPAGDILIHRRVALTVFGDRNWKSNPVSMIRRYSISRGNLSNALSVLESVQELMNPEKVNVIGLMPILSDDMSSLSVSYQFQSVDHSGEVLDGAGTSEEMRSLVTQASEFSTLEAAHLMVPL